MPSPTRRSRRFVAIALAAVALFAVAAPGTRAEPSQSDLDAAEDQLDALNQRLGLLVEEYDAAAHRLRRLEAEVADLEAEAAKAKKAASRARERLGLRAREAYTQGADRLEVLLGSSSFAEFSERLEFLDRITEDEADLATLAEVSRERAQRTAGELAVALQEQRAVVDRLESKRAEIESGIAEQEALVAELERELARPVLPPKPAAPSGPLPSLPDAAPGAQAAIAAAYSVIGTPYKWAGASPEEGFDCSGLTMWAWAHGGVSLPHSSQAQYSVLPHVSRDELQPGDLLFFYTPIHHVAIYLGNDQMIHAPHTGSYVHVQAVYWEHYVGAGRPGV